MKNFWVMVIVGFSASAWGSSGITYYHNDVAGSPVMATNEQAAVMWRALYTSYGSVFRTADSYLASLDNPVWFTGHVQDPQTGLIYMQGRY